MEEPIRVREPEEIIKERLEKEKIEVLRGIREELIKIGEAIRDTAWPSNTR